MFFVFCGVKKQPDTYSNVVYSFVEKKWDFNLQLLNVMGQNDC